MSASAVHDLVVMGAADAAYQILTSSSRECTGNTFLCEDVLVANGITDLTRYSVNPGSTDFGMDLFVDGFNPPGYDR